MGQENPAFCFNQTLLHSSQEEQMSTFSDKDLIEQVSTLIRSWSLLALKVNPRDCFCVMIPSLHTCSVTLAMKPSLPAGHLLPTHNVSSI